MSGAERADAVRNRAAILAAAEELFARDGAEVSMNDIAEAAGVGKGTVFRRFGDRTALIQAVLTPRILALHDRIEGGPPPLGPGGEPVEALHALLDALLDFGLANRALLRALEDRGPQVTYGSPASRYWIAEFRRRLAPVRPDADADFQAHVLLTVLRADLVEHLTGARKMSADRIRAGLHELLGSGG